MKVEIIMTAIALIICIVKVLLYRNKYCENTNIYGNWLSNNNIYYSFNDNGSYVWYKDTNNIKDNYQEGIMVIKNGQKALKELEMTNSQFDSLISKYTNDENNIYHIKLIPKKMVSCGINKNYILGTKVCSYLYIIVLPDGRGIFTNLDTYEVLQFEKIAEA